MPYQCYYPLDVQIRASSDRSLLVGFCEEISPQAHRAVRRLTAALDAPADFDAWPARQPMSGPEALALALGAPRR